MNSLLSRSGTKPTTDAAAPAPRRIHNATCAIAVVGGLFVFKELVCAPTKLSLCDTAGVSSTTLVKGTSTGVFPFAEHVQQHTTRQPAARRACPCCGWTGNEMNPIGGMFSSKARADAKCPNCGSRERHRKTCAYLGYHADTLFQQHEPNKNFRLLHFGPVPIMETALDLAPNVEQIGLDFFAKGYDGKYSGSTLHADLTNLQLPTNFANGAIILHVMEHVPDLDKAKAELHRVLKNNANSWALIEVPIFSTTGKNEDCRDMTNQERIKCGGQDDHLWAFDVQDFQTNVLGDFDCTIVDDELRRVLGAEVYESFRLEYAPLGTNVPGFFCRFRL